MKKTGISVSAFLFALTFAMTSCGNKTSQQEITPDTTSVVEETVAFDDSTAVEETDATADMEDHEITSFLEQIYLPGGAEDITRDSWIRKHCTPEFQRTLRKEYSDCYEGTGYACWVIGGWEDGEDINTNFNGITYEGNGTYAANISSPDVQGTRTLLISATNDNGKILISNVEKTSDFNY